MDGWRVLQVDNLPTFITEDRPESEPGERERRNYFLYIESSLVDIVCRKTSSSLHLNWLESLSIQQCRRQSVIFAKVQVIGVDAVIWDLELREQDHKKETENEGIQIEVDKLEMDVKQSSPQWC